MDGIQESSYPDSIRTAVETGRRLKAATVAMMSQWQYDQKTGDFPEFITGETHILGDLEIQIERWFNEVDVLTRDVNV